MPGRYGSLSRPRVHPGVKCWVWGGIWSRVLLSEWPSVAGELVMSQHFPPVRSELAAGKAGLGLREKCGVNVDQKPSRGTCHFKEPK